MRYSLVKKSSLILISVLIVLFAVFFAVFGVFSSSQNIAYASETGALAPRFSINRFGLINGATVTQNDIALGRLIIELQIAADYTQPVSLVEFQYRQSGSVGYVIGGGGWSFLGKPGDGNPSGANANRTLRVDLSSVFSETVFNGFIYFRAVLDRGDGQPQFFHNEEFLELSIVNTGLNENRNIRDIRLMHDGRDYFAAQHDWVSDNITINVTTVSPIIPTIIEFLFFSDFAHESDVEETDWIPMTATGAGVNTVYTRIVNETYNGIIWFRSRCNATGTQLDLVNSAPRAPTIKIDTRTPNFSVDAVINDLSVPPGQRPVYNESMVSAHDVIYTITPILHTTDALGNPLPTSRMGSGVKFSYSYGMEEIGADGNFRWEPLVPSGFGTFTHPITRNREVLFRGESDAGLMWHRPLPYITRIDKVNPHIVLSAIDGLSQGIVSVGQTPPFNGKAGFASDFITFTIANIPLNSLVNSSAVTITVAIDGGAPQALTSSTFSQQAPFVNRTYVFRAQSEAGLFSEVTFVVTCLSSAAHVLELEQELVIETQNGWAFNAIPIFIKLPNVMGMGLNEYEFRIRYQHATSSQLLQHHFLRAENGFNIYKVYIGQGTTLNTRALQNRTLEIFAYDLARNRSNIFVTPPISIDLVTPSGTVTQGIAESNIILQQGDWANGRVEFKITPVLFADSTVFGSVAGNISGFRLFPVVNGFLGRELNLVDDKFFHFETTLGGTYQFVLLSGAVNTSEFNKHPHLIRMFTEEVNIELTPISYNRMEIFRFDHATDKEGSLNSTNNAFFTLPSVTPVGGEIRVEFTTNHQGAHGAHFNILYQAFTSVIDNQNYINGGNKGYVVLNPTLHGAGVLRYAFILESLAVDRNGLRSRTGIITLELTVDLRTFGIALTYVNIPPDNEGWADTRLANGAFEFIININAAVGQVFDENSLTFQRNLHHACGTESGWQTVVFEAGTLTLRTIGFDQFLIWHFRGVERFDPLRDPNLNTALSQSENQSLGFSFNGRISVRLINSAGRVSPTQQTPTDIKIDNTRPDPLNAVTRMPVNGTIRLGAGGLFEVFSDGQVQFRDTALRNDLYMHFAPVDYYYVSRSMWNLATSPTANDYLDSRFSRLPVSPSHPSFPAYTFSPFEDYYYIFAINRFFGTQRSAYIRMTVRLQGDTPFARISVPGGARDAHGHWLISWQNEARVNLEVFSGNNVPFFLEYKIGGVPSDDEGWTRHSPSLIFPGPFNSGTFSMIFIGDEALRATYNSQNLNPIVNNFDAMVHFRAVTLAGVLARFDAGTGLPHASVRIRMDDRAPLFEYEIAVGNDVFSTAPAHWLTQEAFVTLFPIDNLTNRNRIDAAAANPGGVTYWFSLVGDNFTQLPGNGTHFSTNDLRNALATVTAQGLWAGRGVINIRIQARATASGKVHEHSFTLMIDSMAPNFDIRGRVQVGANWVDISSGDWIAVDSAQMSVAIHAPNVSPVEYFYLITQDRQNPPTSFNDWATLAAGANVFNSADPFPHLIETMSRVWIMAVAGGGYGLATLKFFDVNIDNIAPIILSGGISNNYRDNDEIDRLNPNTYYIDTMITYEAVNLKFARFNNFPLPNGHIIGTNTVDNSNTGGLGDKGGFVHIIVENMAGLRAELIFFMTEFELDINSITLSDAHRELLDRFNEEFLAAVAVVGARRSLTASRQAMFSSQIGRLYDRIEVLQRTVQNYRYFLRHEVHEVTSFTLASYERMRYMLNYFTTADTSIVFPKWLQDTITEGEYLGMFNRLVTQFNILHLQMQNVHRVERMVANLPAINVVRRTDYDNILRAHNEYSSLNNSQRTVFSQALLNKLMELRRVSELLQLTDPNSGIRIEGPNLAGNAALEVTEVARTAQIVQNAQRTMLNMLSPDVPRGIVYVKEFRLDDWGTQAITGNITVHMPIPEEFNNFRRFAVYILTPNGTIVPVSGVEINAWGTGISFLINTANVTLVLAADTAESSDQNASTTMEQANNLRNQTFGRVGDMEIDGELLIYITWSAVSLFVLLLAIVVLLGLRHRNFLKKYNRAYKNSLERKGITRVPKGNPEARSNPSDAHKRMKYD
jgi:hypothetical protein